MEQYTFITYVFQVSFKSYVKDLLQKITKGLIFQEIWIDDAL